MIKTFFVILLILFPQSAYSNENLLTIQQQVERLQREVSDLSKSIFSNSNTSDTKASPDLVNNLSAIDMRIYDLEKDVKQLNANIEEIYFQIEDLNNLMNNFNMVISNLDNNLNSIKKEISNQNISNFENVGSEVSQTDSNSLGSLKIGSENIEETNELLEESKETQLSNTNEQLSPEDEFQIAFDYIRNKNWDEAKESLNYFITKYPENQISGSAHYWLGELFILEKKYRDAALIFAEGYQKFPSSIKAPDMLLKLSQSLFEVNKVDDSCNTINKLIEDFPKSKLVAKAKKQQIIFGCSQLD